MLILKLGSDMNIKFIEYDDSIGNKMDSTFVKKTWPDNNKKGKKDPTSSKILQKKKR